MQVVMLELCVERKELLAPQRPQVPLCNPAVRLFALSLSCVQLLWPPGDRGCT